MLYIYMAQPDSKQPPGDFFETPSLVAVPGLPIEVAESHPELSLLLLYSGLPTETYRQLLDISIARWPHRVEFWYLLALSPEGQSTTRVHAIRRCGRAEEALVFPSRLKGSILKKRFGKGMSI